jgi:hypothetical protein
MASKANTGGMPDAYVQARTLADAARAIGVNEKTFRRWVRSNTGVFVSGKRGDDNATFTPDARASAYAHFTGGNTPE